MKYQRLGVIVVRGVAPVIGFLSIPVYEKLIGTELFPYVVGYISIQSFALVADFGLTLNSFRRESIGLSSRSKKYQISAYSLYIASVLAISAPLILAFLDGRDVSFHSLFIGVLSIFLGCIGNYQISMLLARSSFKKYSISLLAYNVVRHIGSIGLLYFSATISSFLLGQLIGGLLPIYLSRGNGFKIFTIHSNRYIKAIFRQSYIYGFGAMLSVGAITIDKIIIADRLNPEQFSQYYYAFVYGFSVPAILVATLLGVYQADLIRHSRLNVESKFGALAARSIVFNTGVGLLFINILLGFKEDFIKLWLGDPNNFDFQSARIMLIFSIFAFSANPIYSILLGRASKRFLFVTSLVCCCGLLTYVYLSEGDDLSDTYGYAYGLYLFVSFTMMSLRLLLGSYDRVFKSVAVINYAVTCTTCGLLLVLI